jgi:hypothetical protein
MDMDKLRNKLNSLQNQSKREDFLWKPKSGENVIRVVPYKYQDGNYPFIELLFHYNIGGKTYLSPASFGKPDPFLEFSKKLKESGDKDSYTLSKKLEPKSRTFAPILDRKNEMGGVKFWGFGKTVYQDLITTMLNEDFGDITDPQKGHDIKVFFRTAEEAKKQFPETTIQVRPQQTPLATDAAVVKKIGETMKDITELYRLASYDELKEILEKWLEGGTDNAESTESKDKVVESAPAPATKSAAKSTVSTMNVVTDTDNLASQFDDLFKKP